MRTDKRSLQAVRLTEELGVAATLDKLPQQMYSLAYI
jgi:hypothetical protein